MPEKIPTKEELQERAQLVRLYEASCQINHPTAEELMFRRSLMIKIGLAYGLKGVRNGTISEPKAS